MKPPIGPGSQACPTRWASQRKQTAVSSCADVFDRTPDLANHSLRKEPMQSNPELQIEQDTLIAAECVSGATSVLVRTLERFCSSDATARPLCTTGSRELVR